MNAPQSGAEARAASATAGVAAAPGRSTVRWGMTVDVNRCVGCQTCTISCKHTNDTPPGVQWRKVIDVETGTFPDVERLFLVTGCQHCAEPPCVPVCPTGATRQRADGLVTMSYDECIGCGYCAVSCPYQARTIVHDERWYYGAAPTRQEQAVRHDERLGVAQKCTFCVEKVDLAQATGRRPGEDLEVTPACAASCISQAIVFGDFADPTSRVSKLVTERESFQMHAELGTNPQIRYLYSTPAVPGREPSADDLDDERLSDPTNPLVGPLQRFWDWRAAMNWCFGGVGSGLALTAAVLSPVGSTSARVVPLLQAAAGVLMAIGLFFVFLKIGRKLRFWRAVRRVQTSWMTRELYVAVAFYALLLANLVAPTRVGTLLVAIAAGGFLYCQARILHAARGIPAWRTPKVPALVVGVGLLEGAGALAIVPPLLGVSWNAAPIALAGLVLAVVNAWLFHRYRSAMRTDGVVPLARKAIDAIALPVHAVGHLAPAVLFGATLAIGMPGLATLGGLAAIAGGVLLKYTLVVRAGYQQGFALAKLPQRGSGARAAPARTGYAKRPA